MNSKDFIDAFNVIYSNAYNANCCLLLINRYEYHFDRNVDAIIQTPAFWYVTRRALEYACVMHISKVYDDTHNVINITKLLSKDAQEYLSKEYSEFSVSKAELYEQFDLECDGNKDEKLSVAEAIKECGRIKRGIKDGIDLLKTYRCKKYAHNDVDALTDPDSYADIESLEQYLLPLINYALNLTVFIHKMIYDGISTDTAFENIDDIDNLIEIIKASDKRYNND